MVSEIKMYEYPKGTFVVEDSTGFIFKTKDFYNAMEFYLAEKKNLTRRQPDQAEKKTIQFKLSILEENLQMKSIGVK